ncbi:MAG TPA: PAS domain S-box protein [Chitinispirillaceae bacterium]|nr:PAS domain S-box protein [Chitinispirillaceae bacterium]
MNSDNDLGLRCRSLENECSRLHKINEALMNRVEHCSDEGGSSFALFESNLLLQKQIKEHTSRLELVNHDLQQQIVIRRKTEVALKHERDFISAVFDNADVMVAVINRNGILERVNKTCQKIVGRKMEELEGKSLDSLFTVPEKLHEIKTIFDTIVNGGYPYSWEIEWEIRNGETKNIAWSTTAITDESGRVEYVISCGRDITEQKIAEETRRVAEKRYRDLVEFLPQTVYERDRDGNFTFVNNMGLREFGYSIEEFRKGMKLSDIIASEDHEKLFSMMNANNCLGHTSDEVSMVRKDGTAFPAIIYSSPIDLQSECSARRGIVLNISNLRDAERKLEEYRNHLEELVVKRTAELSQTIEQLEIEMSERKLAEEALKNSETKYRFLFEQSPAGCIIVGVDGKLIDINKALLNSLEYQRDELVGKMVIDVIISGQKQLVQSQIMGYLNNISHPELDIGITAKSGSVRYIRFSGQPTIIKEKDEVTGVLISGVDVTKRKEMEELNRRQQERLVHADKMATLGILVSGVAHEINNPNNFILLNSTNLLDIWKDLLPVLDKYLNEQGCFTIAGLPFDEIRNDIEPLITGICEGAERIKRIVESLKDFARKDSGNKEGHFNINAIIEAAIIIMNNLIKRSTDHFSVKLDTTIPEIRGNFQQIEQVIINLVTNACQALTDKTQGVTIVSYNHPGNNEVIIEVADQGKGIAIEHRKHIFDPFFTTKRDSGGTGLGLSVSYNIIKDHRGELTFESEQGNGTMFRIAIPYL